MRQRRELRTPHQLQLSALAGIFLVGSLLLPWYQKSYFATVSGRPIGVTENLSALQVFSFIEATIFLVSLGVLYITWARSKGRSFSLPGGDGTVVLVAGCWSVVLLVWRLFDRPQVNDPGATIGIHWGIFAALLAAGMLALTGARLRSGTGYNFKTITPGSTSIEEQN